MTFLTWCELNRSERTFELHREFLARFINFHSKTALVSNLKKHHVKSGSIANSLVARTILNALAFAAFNGR